MPAAKNTAKPKTIDEYLAPLAADKRAALQKLRRTIRAVMPKAEEVISYSLPAFRLDGRVIIWIGAGAEHCAIYGPNPGLDDELSKYDVSKGTIRFQPDRPLPDSLVRKIVKARVARNASRAKQPKKGKRRA
jgi:uncharacterized protein YdhG (YjbR/CyaY superfamily)